MAGHGLLIAAFTFSAISYSRISRGEDTFISLPVFLGGLFITLSLFFLLRVFDEFKDAKDDAQFRSHLPVPRGLISLKELMVCGIVVVIFQLLINILCFPKMLPLYAVAVFYLLIMGKEFFVAKWLRNQHMLYIISHMLIIPLIDVYASGLDWRLQGVDPPKGLIFFFAVSYFNGVVLEFGRKIRPVEMEAPGVVTYSSLYGAVRATVCWILILLLTFVFAILAAIYAGHGVAEFAILSVVLFVCILPALMFLQRKDQKSSKWIEYASALWTFAMYLCLGGIPMLIRIFIK